MRVLWEILPDLENYRRLNKATSSIIRLTGVPEEYIKMLRAIEFLRKEGINGMTWEATGRIEGCHWRPGAVGRLFYGNSQT